MMTVFLYLSNAPWGQVMNWIVSGLLSPSANEKEMEELGHDYFQELLSRSFFQQSRIGTSLFVMHDLINDLS